ncbi:MAG: hypothetical protein K9N06_14010 [Candidatus Cloacimonetes bacterium]|nr:hypothetical protein [Candidatus Cloacimonadota bacterium]
MHYLIFFILIISKLNLQAVNVWLPCPKPYSGHLEFSAGLHFWDDHLYLRNLQFRSLYYLRPGFRINGVFRGNDQINQMVFINHRKPEYYSLKPIIDELNLEFSGFAASAENKWAASIRLGKMRYLRFPWYGLIGRMDQVVGMSDIRSSNEEAGYKGVMNTVDYIHQDVLGFHNTLYLDGKNSFLARLLESYLYLQYENDWFTLEARCGRLVVRDHETDNVPLDSDWGWNVMSGIKLWNYDVDIFLEKVAGKLYTGVSVKFASSLFSRIAGKLRLDYNRADEGFVVQYPLFYRDINLTSKIPESKVKVGEIVAERVITFWRIGMQRNFYEHIVSRTGITDPDAAEVVIRKKPMLLGIESIVSPVYKFEKLSDFRKWDSEGIRPGQLTQTVVYEFYQ